MEFGQEAGCVASSRFQRFLPPVADLQLTFSFFSAKPQHNHSLTIYHLPAPLPRLQILGNIKIQDLIKKKRDKFKKFPLKKAFMGFLQYQRSYLAFGLLFHKQIKQPGV